MFVIANHLKFFPYPGYMAGKIFMSMFVARFSNEIAFSLIYIYSAELFPTTVRQTRLKYLYCKRYTFKGVRHFNAILKVIVRLNYKHTRFVSAAHANAFSSEKKTDFLMTCLSNAQSSTLQPTKNADMTLFTLRHRFRKPPFAPPHIRDGTFRKRHIFKRL